MPDLSSRRLTPELLDSIPHDDPGAIRSRRDLARINCFMGNDRWIIRKIPDHPAHITEIGAGDGLLLSKISKLHPRAEISAYDLAPRPAHLAENISWHRGDIFAQAPPAHGGVLIANLFLHHFTEAQLATLGTWMRGFGILLFSEPLRASFPLLMGKLATPFIHPITRHDMRVSIEAGFRPGELPDALRIDRKHYQISETAHCRGSIRMVILRN
ncbi:hypothetical protein HZ994_15910 [Akkermansiaceae bacterium]|nr:hypothetical protein HZ994_15910 [Akkermansiaceae bacterium]